MRNRLTEQPEVAPRPGRAVRPTQQPAAPGDDAVSLDYQAWLDEAGKFIGRHPAICLAAAVAGGVLLGTLLKRWR